MTSPSPDSLPYWGTGMNVDMELTDSFCSPRAYFPGSVCKEPVGIFHRSPCLPFKAAQIMPDKVWVSAQLLSTVQLLMVPSLSSQSWALSSSLGPFISGDAQGVETNNCTNFFSFTFLVEAEEERGEQLSCSVCVCDLTGFKIFHSSGPYSCILHYWLIMAFTIR